MPGTGVSAPARWLILALVIISTLNAIPCKLPNLNPNACLKIQWYPFARRYTLLGNGPVRVDIFNTHLRTRVRIGIEFAGTVPVLFPFSPWVL